MTCYYQMLYMLVCLQPQLQPRLSHIFICLHQPQVEFLPTKHGAHQGYYKVVNHRMVHLSQKCDRARPYEKIPVNIFIYRWSKYKFRVTHNIKSE